LKLCEGDDMKKARDAVLDALSRASQGLRYVSETDAGFEPFAWEHGGALTEGRLLELAGEEPGTAVEATSPDDFFGAVPAEDRAAFQELAEALRAQLSGVKVYKVGDEAERRVYLVGQARDGRWAGLKTTVVET
jgi:hypothetical protein